MISDSLNLFLKIYNFYFKNVHLNTELCINFVFSFIALERVFDTKTLALLIQYY